MGWGPVFVKLQGIDLKFGEKKLEFHLTAKSIKYLANQAQLLLTQRILDANSPNLYC